MKTKILIFVLLACNSLFGQIPMPLLKATFIYNFAAQTEWPESYRTGDFVIGIIGESPVATELTKIANTKKIGTQKIVLKTYQGAASLEKCHLIFISESQSSKTSEIVTAVGTNSTLIVSEGSDLCKKGSMMNFILKSDKLGFEMSKNNMSKVNLKPTTYLEKLATPVN